MPDHSAPLMGVQTADAVAITGGSVTGITDLAVADGGTGASTAGGAATNLSLGTGNSPTFTNVIVSGYFQGSVGNALTAAGNNRATALQLAAQINNITTAAASTGAALPSAATVGVGGFVIVFNGGANAAQIYGLGSDTIDGVAGSTGVALTNAKRCVYFCVAAATFISAQLGVVSA